MAALYPTLAAESYTTPGGTISGRGDVDPVAKTEALLA